jgi:tripartite-type tricarboxylate transporter receptor subunit TctC
MEPQVAAGKVKILAQLGREKDPDYPDVPLILDLAATAADRQILELAFAQQVMAWPLVAPPGVPAERIKALRDAFDATMRDPDFLAEAARQKLIINPVSGEKISTLLDRVYAMPKDVLDRVAALSERN